MVTANEKIDQLASHAVRLDAIAGQVRRWIDWDKGQRAKEGLATEEGTVIMSLPVPVWPTHGQFQNWTEALTVSAALLRIAKRQAEREALPANADARAAVEAPSTELVGVFVVAKATDEYLYWLDDFPFGWAWTTDIEKALWFARRKDAEAAASESMDAWRVLPIAIAQPRTYSAGRGETLHGIAKRLTGSADPGALLGYKQRLRDVNPGVPETMTEATVLKVPSEWPAMPQVDQESPAGRQRVSLLAAQEVEALQAALQIEEAKADEWRHLELLGWRGFIAWAWRWLWHGETPSARQRRLYPFSAG